MNNLNKSVDEVVECPLCMEPLEVDDLNFFPCTCGYQICRFCWHRIRTDENELCPACRKEYPENPADFKPLTQEEMIAFKSQKRQRDQQRKQKITENRKHLANVRVVQKNLVFVVGLPPRLADADILKKHEYFGKYGKIHKVVINPSTTYAGIQGPSASAYVTYVHNTDALKAIQSVNNVMIDGRLIKTSLGTTKYCSHFMKNQPCPKADCMYLHELGDPEASFTKEEMHQGKHQEYEKRLHDVLIASSTGCGITVGSTSTLSNIKNSESSKINGISSNAAMPNSTSASLCLTNNLPPTAVSCTPKKEAWPSLSISPVTRNDSGLSNVNKNKKERTKPDKNKIDKNCRSKNNKNSIDTTLNPLSNEVDSNVAIQYQSTDNDFLYEQSSKLKDDKRKERNQHSLVNTKKELCIPTTAGNERPFCNLSDPVASTSLNLVHDNVTKIDNQRFLSFGNNSSSFVIAPSENNSIVSKGKCGQSSPGSCNETNANNECVKSPSKCKRSSTSTSELSYETESENSKTNLSEIISKTYVDELFRNNENAEHKMQKDSINNNTAKSVHIKEHTDNNRYEVNYNNLVRKENKGDDYVTDSMSNLKMFDENSYFSSRTAISNPSIPLSFTHNEDLISNQLSCTAVPNLPDLINGIDGYQNTTNEWEEALKNVINKTSKQMEEQNLQKRPQISTQSHVKHQEDLQRFQELHKPKSILKSLGTSQISGAQTDSQNCTNNYLIGPDFCRQSNYSQFQQQLQESSNANGMQNSLFGTNMSKFFDFHKHQQQKLQTSLHISGHNNINGTVNENFHMMSTFENNTLNSQMMDQSCSLTAQQHHQKLKPFGKIDGVLCHSTLQQVSNQKIASAATQQNQYAQNMGSDDDLGFDPFIETQKALAELIENDEKHNVGTTSLKLINHKGVNNVHQPHQQHVIEYMQRSRMPPPGFNHVNNFSGYGVVPRIQNSNVLSLMKLSTNNASSTGPHVQHPHHLPIPSNAWGAQLGNYQQHLNDQQVQANSNQILGSGNLKGYTGNDWTAMDPAILSFRQFSFPQQVPQIQPQQQELCLQHVTQHQQGPGFTSQSQHATVVPNTVMNAQQSSQTHVNANVQGMLEYLKTRQFV